MGNRRAARAAAPASYWLTGAGRALATELADVGPVDQAGPRRQPYPVPSLGGRGMKRRYGTVIWLLLAAVWAPALALAMAESAPGSHRVSIAIIVSILLTPATVAVAIWRAWWRRFGVKISTMDGPAQVLATAVAVLDRTIGGTGVPR